MMILSISIRKYVIFQLTLLLETPMETIIMKIIKMIWMIKIMISMVLASLLKP